VSRPTPRRVETNAPHNELLRAVAWAAAALLLLGILGWIFVPSLALVWLILIVLGIFAVPQAIAGEHGRRRRATHKRKGDL